MPRVLCDSSIYISSLRAGQDAALRLGRLAPGASLWLSSVVLEELYAGADSRVQKVLERLERGFDRAKRILVPNLTDWSRCGKLLALLAAKYGYERIGQGRLTNDALIAMSAARMGITVITANKRDFSRMAGIRPFSWQLQDL